MSLLEKQTDDRIPRVNDAVSGTNPPIDPEAFARTWIDAWNRSDIDALVSHYAMDIRFVSPVAAQRTGSSMVHGREALASYWSGARQYKKFVFEFESLIWDPIRLVLAIVYRRQVDDRRDRAVEIFHFRSDGLVQFGEALYGARLA